KDDLDSSRIDPDEVPFVSKSDLEDYCHKQVEPLIDQVRTAGADRAMLQRLDKQGMNAFSGLLLFADATYGSGSLMRMLEYLPRAISGQVRAVDFLDGLTNWLNHTSVFVAIMPGNRRIKLLLPSGEVSSRVAKGKLYDQSDREKA